MKLPDVKATVPDGMLLSMQYARALAALLVVWAHLSGFAIFRPAGLPEFGGMGVDIFFVISGFIIAQTAPSQRPLAFAARRLIRILPAYWFYTLLLVALALLAPSLAPRVTADAGQIFRSLFFVPYINQRGELNPILLQGWSLNYEMFFYLVYALALMFSTRRVQLAFVVGSLGVLVALGLMVRFHGAAAQIYTNVMMLEFLLGVGLSRIIAARPYPIVLHAVALVGGVAWLVTAELWGQSGIHRALILGPGAALFLFGLIGFEALMRRRPVAVMRRLGDASYSLYLSHSFVLSGTALVFRSIEPATTHRVALMHAVLFGLVSLVCTGAFARMSFALLERPSASWLIGLTRRMSTSTKPPTIRNAQEGRGTA